MVAAADAVSRRADPLPFSRRGVVRNGRASRAANASGRRRGRWSGALAQHVSRFGIKRLPLSFLLPSASLRFALRGRPASARGPDEAQEARCGQSPLPSPCCRRKAPRSAANAGTVGCLYSANSPLSWRTIVAWSLQSGTPKAGVRVLSEGRWKWKSPNSADASFIRSWACRIILMID